MMASDDVGEGDEEDEHDDDDEHVCLWNGSQQTNDQSQTKPYHVNRTEDEFDFKSVGQGTNDGEMKSNALSPIDTGVQTR